MEAFKHIFKGGPQTVVQANLQLLELYLSSFDKSVCAIKIVKYHEIYLRRKLSSHPNFKVFDYKIYPKDIPERQLTIVLRSEKSPSISFGSPIRTNAPSRNTSGE